jgi:hypothetical protein
MADSRTLSGVLGFDAADSGAAAGTGKTTGAEELVAKAIQAFPALRLFNVAPGLGAELVRLLSVPLREIAATAWNKRAEIRKFSDATKYPPDQTNQVSLHEHEIKQTLNPTIEIQAEGLSPTVKLVFTVLTTLKLQSAILLIRGGCITHVQLGKLTVTAHLKYQEIDLLKKERSWPVDVTVALGREQRPAVHHGAGPDQ